MEAATYAQLDENITNAWIYLGTYIIDEKHEGKKE